MGFAAWFGSLPHAHKLIIAGNHEESFDLAHFLSANPHSDREELQSTNARARASLLNGGCEYLEDDKIDVCGLRIYGSPYQPAFNSWAFNLPRGPPLQEKWEQIPSDIDILVTHGPPLG